MLDIMQHAIELFISSMPPEEGLHRELCIRLAPLVEGGLVRETTPLEEGTQERRSIGTADVVVVLLGPEAMVEGSVVRATLDEAIELEQQKRAVVVPIRARAYDVEHPKLANRIVYPRDGRSLDDAEHQEAVFRDALAGVLTGIALCHVTVGDYLLEREREVLAAAAFRRALAIADRLISEDPEDHDHLVLLAVTRDRLADALLAAGDGPAALGAYENAKRIREQLVRMEPSHHDKRRALARCHESIGEVLRAMGEKPEALVAYQACLAIREVLAKEAPHEQSKRELYATFGRLGHVLRAMGDLKAALDAFRAGMRLVEELSSEREEAAAHRAEHALFCFRVATVLGDGTPADRAEARLMLKKSLELYRDLEERSLLTPAQAIWPPAVEALLDTIDG